MPILFIFPKFYAHTIYARIYYFCIMYAYAKKSFKMRIIRVSL